MANSAIGSRLGRAAMVDRFARGNSKLCMFKVQTSHRHRSAILCRPNSLASAKHEQKDATQRISFAPMDADRLKRLAHLAGIPLPRIARLAGMAGNGGQATARRPHHQRGDPQQVPPSGKGSAFSIRARDGTSTRSMETLNAVALLISRHLALYSIAALECVFQLGAAIVLSWA
jgi:hypothetical protein